MNGRKNGGDGEDGHVLSTRSKQGAQNKASKECLFDEWNDD